jgi:hypothetical protein
MKTFAVYLYCKSVQLIFYFIFHILYFILGGEAARERDSSGTTAEGGDGADSPTRGAERAEAARPKE